MGLCPSRESDWVKAAARSANSAFQSVAVANIPFIPGLHELLVGENWPEPLRGILLSFTVSWHNQASTTRNFMPFKNQHPLYSAWKGMVGRCHVKSNPAYADYGARGIIVCDRWRVKGQGFWNFLEDMGPRPDKHTIERIDNNGNYEPSNCRWATRKEQQRNRRVTLYITIEGVKYIVAALAEEYGFKADTIVARAKTCTTFAELVDKKKRVFTEGLKAGILASAEARNKRTHCKNGHEYTEASTYIQKANGYEWRCCRICHAIRQAEATKKKKQILTQVQKSVV
jgi:hypothetical protein